VSNTKLNDGLEAVLDHLRKKACEHIDEVIKHTTGHLSGGESITQTRAILAHLDEAFRGWDRLHDVFTVGPEDLWKDHTNQLKAEKEKPLKQRADYGAGERACEDADSSKKMLKEIYQLTFLTDFASPRQARDALAKIRQITNIVG
jgi:hypothetical protein